MRPGSVGAADGLLQADAAEKLERIADLRREADRLESSERWDEAAVRYAEVLALDGTIVFAREGERRCRDRGELARQLDFHIAHRDRLSADAVFDEASALLEEARATEPAGPQHRRQVEDLAALIRVADVKVRVRLESDDETEVTVYRVGRLGKFESHELELRPGTYTVVGSRRGYRDVRRTLVVVAGQRPEPLVVRCEERI